MSSCSGFDPARQVIENALGFLTMAQTRRKRQTKHRGNAAGVIESRGRTGRKPTAAEKRGETRAGAKATRANRYDRPPTWRGAFWRALIAAAILMVVIALLLTHKPADCVRAVPDRARDLRADQLLHRPVDVPAADAREGPRGEGGVVMSALDVRSFTVGPVQENCYIVAPPTGSARRRAGARRARGSRRRGASGCSRPRRRSACGSRRS